MNTKRKIVIFGAGEMGTKAIRGIMELWSNEIEIATVIDNGRAGEEVCLGNRTLRLQKQEALKGLNFDILLLCIANNRSIYDELVQDIAPEKILRLTWNNTTHLLQRLASRCGLDGTKLEFRIRFLAVIVGSACNLRCRDCANFAPYAPPASRRYKLEDLMGWTERVLSAVDGIEKLHVQGGEPFVYSDLGPLLAFLCEQEKIKTVQIATNGMLIPEEDILAVCRHPKIEVRISNYGGINRKQAAELKRVLGQNGIRTRDYGFATKDDTWRDMGGIDTPRQPSDEKTEASFQACAFNDCVTLENGQIAYCSRAIVAQLLQGFNGNYLRVEDKDFHAKFRDFYFNKKFMEACRYCKGTELYGGGGNTCRCPAPAVQLS